MKKKYEKPSMAITIFDVSNTINNVTALSAVYQNSATADAKAQSTYGMTKLNLSNWHS